jgi:orotidine 5''-phosphate decarboxylase, subfamily 1
MVNRNHNIVASLDMVEEQKLLKMAEEIGDYIFAIKINWPTILACGKQIISKLGKYTSVICDLKIADVPNTVDLIMKQIEMENPYAVITHLFTGLDSLKTIANNRRNVKVIGVASMSNPGAKKYLNPNYLSLIEDAYSAGCYGIVGPGNDYELLSKMSTVKREMKIFCPGIGAQGGNYREALKTGGDYMIIGRSLYENPSPIDYILNLEKI